MFPLDLDIEQVYDCCRVFIDYWKGYPTMAADYEVVITVKANVPSLGPDFTGLDAIAVAMDYGIGRFIADGEYQLVNVGVEKRVFADVDDDDDTDDEDYQPEDNEPDDDADEEAQTDDVEPQEDDDESEVDEADEDTDGAEEGSEADEVEGQDEDAEEADDEADFVEGIHQQADDTDIESVEPDKGNITFARRTPKINN